MHQGTTSKIWTQILSSSAMNGKIIFKDFLLPWVEKWMPNSQREEFLETPKIHCPVSLSFSSYFLYSFIVNSILFIKLYSRYISLCLNDLF